MDMSGKNAEDKKMDHAAMAISEEKFLRVDNEFRPMIGIGRSIMVFSRFLVFGYYEYQIDAGWVNNLESGQNFGKKLFGVPAPQYMLSKNFLLIASYDSRFGAGGGLSFMF